MPEKFKGKYRILRGYKSGVTINAFNQPKFRMAIQIL